MKNLKVLIADDHAIVRHGLCALLNTEHGIEVVGEAKDGNEAVALAKQLAPDVVVMDIVMPRKDGVEATAEIRSAMPEAKIVVLTSFGTSDKISRAIEAGAAGKVFKIEANVGATVKAGDTVVIIEAMKMEIPVVAPKDGTVASIDCAVGDACAAGQLLATLK